MFFKRNHLFAGVLHDVWIMLYSEQMYIRQNIIPEME